MATVKVGDEIYSGVHGVHMNTPEGDVKLFIREDLSAPGVTFTPSVSTDGVLSWTAVWITQPP